MDPIAILLCGLGSVIGHDPRGDLFHALLVAAAFYGLCRACGSRAAPWLVGAVGLAYGLEIFWKVVAPRYTFSLDHPTLFAAPQAVADLVTQSTMIAGFVIARRRLGTGLTVIVISATVIAYLFGVIHGLIDPKDKSLESIASFAEAVSRGWGPLRSTLSIGCWLLIGVGAPAVDASPRRVSAIVGIVGTSLLFASWTAIEQAKEGALLLSIATLLVGFICTTVAIARLTGLGGGAATITGMILLILQILALPLLLAWTDDQHERPGDAIHAGLALGFLGLGLAVTIPTALPLQRLRFVLGFALLIATAGMTLTFLRLVFRSRMDPHWGVEVFANPGVNLGLGGLVGYYAFLTAPPKVETVEAAAQARDR